MCSCFNLRVCKEVMCGSWSYVWWFIWSEQGGDWLVDWADVVESTAGDEVARGGVGAGHHPRGTEGDRVHLCDTSRYNLCVQPLSSSLCNLAESITHFVGGVRVPDDEFAILWGWNQVSGVCAPMHSINLGSTARILSQTNKHSSKGSLSRSCDGV